jgi:starch synthase
VVGTGEPALEQAVTAAAQRHPGRVGAIIGYDEDLSHLMHGGCDTILSPSRFEPCGLTQLYGMRYGCVPIAARTGGLSDTIVDANHAGLGSRVATGFLFSPVDQPSLEDALAHAADCFTDPALWQSLQKHGMAQDVSWDRSAAAYTRLYRELTEG